LAVERLGAPGFGVGVFGLQITGVVRRAGIVREGDALRTQTAQLGATLGDQCVLVGCRWLLLAVLDIAGVS
jgi:hypothetical protein